MYLHELSGWPKFSWYHKDLESPLGAVRYRQGRLAGRMEGYTLPLRREAALLTLTRDIAASGESDGHILDGEQIRTALAQRLKTDLSAPAPASTEVEGVVAMMVDAAQNYEAPLTKERLLGWRAAPSGRGGFTISGAWRDDPSAVIQAVSGSVGGERGHHQAPASGRLDREMQAFLQWFNGKADVDPVLKAAIAHLWFATLHPFVDGNGRIARAITDMALARSEGTGQRFYSLSAQMGRERDAYVDILEATQKANLDITRWLDWFLRCLDRAIDNAESLLAGVLRKGDFWRRHAGAFNARQRDMLNRLLDGFDGKLTSSHWAEIQTCSPDTALRDITELVARGILKKDAGGGRSTSYSLAEGALTLAA